MSVTQLPQKHQDMHRLRTAMQKIQSDIGDQAAVFQVFRETI